MAIPSAHCKLDAESIKAATGQFDLESVFRLAMPHMGLRAIESLALCPNLTVRTGTALPKPHGASGLQHSHLSLACTEGLGSKGLSKLRRMPCKWHACLQRA